MNGQDRDDATRAGHRCRPETPLERKIMSKFRPKRRLLIWATTAVALPGAVAALRRLAGTIESRRGPTAGSQSLRAAEQRMRRMQQFLGQRRD